MGFYTKYKAVFDGLKAAIETKQSIKEVIIGEDIRLGKLPLAIITPEETLIGVGTNATTLEVEPEMLVTVLIRETNLKDVFENIIAPLSDVIDAVTIDPTLKGVVRVIYPTNFAPAEIKFNNRTYQGGVVRFKAAYKQGTQT